MRLCKCEVCGVAVAAEPQQRWKNLHTAVGHLPTSPRCPSWTRRGVTAGAPRCHLPRSRLGPAIWVPPSPPWLMGSYGNGEALTIKERSGLIF